MVTARRALPVLMALVSAVLAPAAKGRLVLARKHVPNPPGLHGTELNAVSCARPRMCLAVGTGSRLRGNHAYRGDLPAAERWNGSRWQSLAPIAGQAGELRTSGMFNAVSCMSARRCMAVGEIDLEHRPWGQRTLAEEWNGDRWTLLSTPNPGGHLDALTGVSCPSVNWCMAVGYSAPRTNGPLVEVWNGRSWSRRTIHRLGGAFDPELLGVSCTTSRACVAVGDDQNGTALIERWTGSHWYPTVLYDDAFESLAGVSCVSTHVCMAVGTLGDSSGTYSDVVGWNGHRWSNMFSGSYQQDELGAISCSRRSFCLAVDDASAGPPESLETWNGRSWLTLYPRLLNGSTVDGVSCVRRSCMAVGFNASGPASIIARAR